MAKKKKGAFSKLIVSFVIVANVLFTSVVLYIFYKIQCEPVALIGAWFSFTTVEVWTLGTIKKKKEGFKND